MKSILANKKTQLIIKLLPLITMILIFVMFLFSGKEMTLKTLLSYTPDNYYLASVFILFLYALKSICTFLPVTVINILAGTIFPIFPALMLNAAGMALFIIISYWIGALSGSEYADKLTAKYPKVKALVEKQRGSEWFISYFMRVLPLPHDIVSIYLGSLRVAFQKYFIAGMIGSLPGIISATLIGSSISNPFSLKCIISVSAMLLLSIISYVAYIIICKKHKKVKLTKV